jgi:hypothetical protein
MSIDDAIARVLGRREGDPNGSHFDAVWTWMTLVKYQARNEEIAGGGARPLTEGAPFIPWRFCFIKYQVTLFDMNLTLKQGLFAQCTDSAFSTPPPSSKSAKCSHDGNCPSLSKSIKLSANDLYPAPRSERVLLLGHCNVSDVSV